MMFLLKYCYDECEGYSEEVLGVFSTEELADKLIERRTDRHVAEYNESYESRLAVWARHKGNYSRPIRVSEDTLRKNRAMDYEIIEIELDVPLSS